MKQFTNCRAASLVDVIKHDYAAIAEIGKAPASSIFGFKVIRLFAFPKIRRRNEHGQYSRTQEKGKQDEKARPDENGVETRTNASVSVIISGHHIAPHSVKFIGLLAWRKLVVLLLRLCVSKQEGYEIPSTSPHHSVPFWVYCRTKKNGIYFRRFARLVRTNYSATDLSICSSPEWVPLKIHSINWKNYEKVVKNTKPKTMTKARKARLRTRSVLEMMNELFR